LKKIKYFYFFILFIRRFCRNILTDKKGMIHRDISIILKKNFFQERGKEKKNYRIKKEPIQNCIGRVERRYI